MFDCLKPFFSAPVIATDFESYCKAEGSLIGAVMKRKHGAWSSRLAELKKGDELLLFKSATVSKKYILTGMKKLLLGSGTNTLHARMTLENGTKLYLKIKGPDRNEWGSRITNCKFPKESKELKKEEQHPEDEISTLQEIPSTIQEFIRPPPTPVPKPRSIFPSDCYYPPICDLLSTPMTSYSSIPSTQVSSVSMQSTQQQPIIDENSLVFRMARVFEPGFISRKETIRHY